MNISSPPHVLNLVTSSHLPQPYLVLFQSVEMHNRFQITPVVRREQLTITLSVDDCTDLKITMHFYSHTGDNSSAYGERLKDFPELQG